MTSIAHDSIIYPQQPQLVYYGHPTLRTEAKTVNDFSPQLRLLFETMFEIMEKNNGIGLAAPQIAIPGQIVAINLEAYDLGRLSIVNPQIKFRSEETGPYDEGCLSVPGIYETVMRPLQIVVEAQDQNGKEIEIKADGILARVLQHEIDHLHGILFVDHLDDYIRKEYTKELKLIKKMNKNNADTV